MLLVESSSNLHYLLLSAVLNTSCMECLRTLETYKVLHRERVDETDK